jgi:lactoylglutathione lyase
MRFGYAILYVEDVEATLKFYERAFGFTRGMLTDDKNYGELDTGATRLAFAANSFVRTMIPLDFGSSEQGRAAPRFELGFVAADVEAAFRQAIEAGATKVKQPEQRPWGQLVGYVQDLNGFLVEICSEMP